jgi:hypothetical protein
MNRGLKRRRFLQTASALGLSAELGPWASLKTITPLRANEARVSPQVVRFRPEIEPVVRLIEETPRERALEVAISQLKSGLSYRNLLAGLFLAGIRNIKPRPVGFKFHAVMVINSAHLLGQSSAVTERLLPLLWALDNFKASQAQDVKEGDWALAPVDESRVMKPHQARADFIRAMDGWDAEAADAAVAALCRSSGAAETMEPLWRVAVRDQRNIGHKAIFAAQSWRTLQSIGWEHAEPVLRSLVFGLLDLQGDAQARPVGPYEANLENAAKIRGDWQIGREDPAATQALLQVIRQATPETASAEALKLLNQGIAPGSLWDAVVLSACELLMQNPNIIAVHATTATNALHFIFTACGDDRTRRLALLQAVGWQPMYRARSKPPNSTPIDALKPGTDVSDSSGVEAVADIFTTINNDRNQAAAKAMAYLARGGSAESVFDMARRMIFHKGRDSHDYKYGAALSEEFLWSTDSRWRGPLLAASMFNLPGAKTPDSPLMTRARDAMATVMSRS